MFNLFKKKTVENKNENENKNTKRINRIQDILGEIYKLKQKVEIINMYPRPNAIVLDSPIQEKIIKLLNNKIKEKQCLIEEIYSKEGNLYKSDMNNLHSLKNDVRFFENTIKEYKKSKHLAISIVQSLKYDSELVKIIKEYMKELETELKNLGYSEYE